MTQGCLGLLSWGLGLNRQQEGCTDNSVKVGYHSASPQLQAALQSELTSCQDCMKSPGKQVPLLADARLSFLLVRESQKHPYLGIIGSVV